jgi:C-terminal processing protease CtpA/Prc
MLLPVGVLAFAVKPLIQHMISERFDAGGFVSQRWKKEQHRAPVKSDFIKAAPWQGWSIREFWRDVQEKLVVRIQFSPMENPYLGDVYVLTSQKTASAAELAADALKSSGRATIIGETTAGEMLSQKPYDIDTGFHLYLPVADYYSVQQGRIEGVGVKPDHYVESEGALEFVLEKVRQ